MADEPKPGEMQQPKPEETVALPKAEHAALTALKEQYTPPEKYDLKLPEGSRLPSTFIEGTAAIARTLGLSQKKAEELFKSFHETVSGREAALAADNKPGEGAAWKARVDGWEKEALADKVIGGTPENLKASSTLAKRVLTHFDEPDAVKFLDDTGMGSHPAVVRLLVKIGKSMKEADFIKPQAGGEGDKPKTRREDRMFPTHKKETQE